MADTYQLLPSLACLGDSLTEGYDIDLSVRWTRLLQQSTGRKVINSGISGDTTGGMLARFQQDVLVHQPSHLFFMGGTNDLWMNLPNEVILSNVLAITRQARYHEIQAIIGIPPPVYLQQGIDDDPPIFLDNRQLAKRLQKYQMQLRQFVDRDDWPVVDFSKMPQDLFLPDGVHVNEAGQEVMAKMVETVWMKIS